ncbi:uncharacterized protein TNCV_4307281 [Trichonephila clavipes]|nr:uncharacterized protein TNCV_4307281 [Trichonephila clavipes]
MKQVMVGYLKFKKPSKSGHYNKCVFLEKKNKLVTNLNGTFPLIFLGVFLGNINSRLFPINSKKKALGGSLPQINLGVQGVTKGGHHSSAQRVNPEFTVGSNFRIIPEQYFSVVENVVEFLENMDNNLTYYEIPTKLAYAYLKGHLTGRALDWFEVLVYRVVKDKARDYTHLKQALSEQFPVVRNRSKLETCLYSSSQKHNQKPSDFVYDLLKIHKS